MLPSGGVGVEVGVWKGDNAARLLKQARPKRLYLVDPWEHRPDLGANAWYGPRSNQASMDAIYESVRDRFADDKRVAVVRARSLEFRREDMRSDEIELDWAYIDGDHAYDGVRGDLEHYARLVRSGGYLLGDDYGLKGGWWGDGVTRAVDEFALAHDYELTILGNQFLMQV
jgi:Methyltransferase domain